MLNITEEVIIIFYIPNSINHNFSFSNITQFLSTCECSVPELSASEWAFMDRETDGNAEALTGRESDISNDDEDWDVKTLSSGENGFSIEDREIGADINEEMLIDNEANAINQIWATIEYGALDSIALNL